MRAALSILVVVSVAAAAEAGNVAPVATGYIYRSDNNGPASLIQLGAVPYKQPHAFAPPLPLLTHPLKLGALETFSIVPAPLPYIATKPILVQDTEDDDDDESEESGEDYLDGDELTPHHEHSAPSHGHAHEKGAGSEYGEEHHAAHGEKGSKGYSSKNHHADGESGHYGKEHQEGFHKEGEGEEKSHHDEVDSHRKHYEAAKGHKGGDHGHKKHFSKGEDVTGYHKVYQKDEFKKDHDFYDVADNSGHFKKYDNEHKKHGSEGEGHKERGHHDSAQHKGEFGKAGFQAKGHNNESEKGHSSEEGQESHYNHEKDYGKKGRSEHEKDYEYDDEEDED